MLLVYMFDVCLLSLCVVLMLLGLLDFAWVVLDVARFSSSLLDVYSMSCFDVPRFVFPISLGVSSMLLGCSLILLGFYSMLLDCFSIVLALSSMLLRFLATSGIQAKS